MDTRKITTKDKAQLLLTGASIDGNYGTWSSIQEYEDFITNDVGLDEPFDSTTIAVKDASTGKITKYIRENGVWREDVPAALTAQIVGIANSINTVEGNVTALQGSFSALDTKVDNNIESMAESAQAAAQSASSAEASAQTATTHLATIQEQIGKMTDSEGVIIPEQVVLNVSEQQTQLDTLGSEIKQKMPDTINDEGGDFGFADEEGNVIARFTDGHIKTKNFDSSKMASPISDGLMTKEQAAKVQGVEQGAQVNEVTTEDTTDEDLAISDEQGNAIAIFSEGHFKTKNFDSRKGGSATSKNVAKIYSDDSNADLNIGDPKGNVLLEIKNGHIKTKNFNSASIDEGVHDINLTMSNLRYKLASLERGENVQCVIGLLGDSWTQHHNCDTSLDRTSGLVKHSNYVQPFAKYLRDKYGNAGGGFYSFSMSHNGVAKMMSVDFDDAQDTRSATESGLITYRDQESGCRWVDCADATFHQGATLTLNIKTAHDKLIVHFYGESGGGVFSYKLDGDTAVQVNSANYTGHSTIEIPCSDTTHTLVFNQESGSTMIFGVDMQRTNNGVRVHKFGNKGINANQFANYVDVNCWCDAVESFNLDTMTILLGTNDGATNQMVGTNIKAIANRIKSVNEFVDLCIIQPSDNASGSGNIMLNQSKQQYATAKELGVGFLNLRPLFGSPQQILNKGTFVSDGLHPTWNGGRMIADYLIKNLL